MDALRLDEQIEFLSISSKQNDFEKNESRESTNLWTIRRLVWSFFEKDHERLVRLMRQNPPIQLGGFENLTIQ